VQPSSPGTPVARLRGDLRAQTRFGALARALGDPKTEPEGALLVLLARLLSDEEIATLILLVKRASQAGTVLGCGD
jgi:hypothetical protein